MKLDKIELYAVTDRSWLGGRIMAECVRNAIEGGVDIVQVREKGVGFEEFVKRAKEVKVVTDEYGIPLIINDDIKVMLACDADGVHVGQDDMSIAEIRERVGDSKIIGVSAHTVSEAVAAEKAGADYLGVGAVFGTSTKKDAGQMDLQMLCDIVDAVSIPIVAIGGINEDNIGLLKDTKVSGAAVVSAIFAKSDIRYACQLLKNKFKNS